MGCLGTCGRYLGRHSTYISLHGTRKRYIEGLRIQPGTWMKGLLIGPARRLLTATSILAGWVPSTRGPSSCRLTPFSQDFSCARGLYSGANSKLEARETPGPTAPTTRTTLKRASFGQQNKGRYYARCLRPAPTSNPRQQWDCRVRGASNACFG